MKVEVDMFLRLVEDANTIAMIDIEATGLRADYSSVLCVSTKRFQDAPQTLAVKRVGDDRKVCREAKELLESFDCWVTYFGKGYDIKFLNTRLLRYGIPPIEKRPHVDMYYMLKSNVLTARKSQGHLLAWLQREEEKMTVGASVWADMPHKFQENMKIMIERCESDVRGLQSLYEATRHLVADIRR